MYPQPELFPEHKVFIFSGILDISAWIFHRRLNFTTPQTELSSSSNLFFLLYSFSPVAQGEIGELALFFSFSFFLTSNPSHNLVYSTVIVPPTVS